MSDKDSSDVIKKDRTKRVKRLKKMITGILILGLMIPILLCVFFMYKLAALEKKVDELQHSLMQMQEAESKQTMTKGEIGLTPVMEQAETEETQPGTLTQEQAPTEETRKVYLTFDDGPSEYTEEILDILQEYGVKATFFVTGQNATKYPNLYKEIVDKGHTLGMHSYSHDYQSIYASTENFSQDLTKLQEFPYNMTGVKPTIYRFPGGSSNTVSKVPMEDLEAYLTKEGIRYFDWNISSKDASPKMLSAQEIVDNCLGELNQYQTAMILMHDASDKRTTVEALPIVIEGILAMDDTQILPVSEETILIQHKKKTNE